MNSRLSQLDGLAVVSNSDAHSPRKLAREATCFDGDLSYDGMLSALRDRDPARLTGTIEFYPQEGKYHYDGHRKCGVCWRPEETQAADGLCPECGRKLTVGVLHRIEMLADRGTSETAPVERAFEYLIPLEEVIGSAVGVGPNSKRVQGLYHKLVANLGPELDVLRTVDIARIARFAEPLVAEGVRRMRAGEVMISPGYDGEYGKIQVFSDEERKQFEGQARLFDLGAAVDTRALDAADVMEAMAEEEQEGKTETLLDQGRHFIAVEDAASGPERLVLDEQQRAAVEAKQGPVIVSAGPGSGKTRTLVQRVAHLIRRRDVLPGRIFAVTFTNKAADEMRQRLRAMDPPLARIDKAFVGTFHRLALHLMGNFGRGTELAIVDAHDALAMVEAVVQEQGASVRTGRAYENISRWKAEGLLPSHVPVAEAEMARVYSAYQERLRRFKARDYDDILLDFLHLLEEDEGFSAYARGCIQHLLVDEFQDVNAVQYRLTQKLAGDGSGLFVIGDPRQSIYGFRGADPLYFDVVSSTFAASERIELTANYRARDYLIQAANAVAGIAASEAAAAADDGPGQALREIATASDLSEGIAVVREVARCVGGADMVQTDSGMATGEYGFGDIAVLFRTGRQAEMLETCFLTEGLPYRLVGQRGYLEARPVREALAFFRFAASPQSGLRLLTALRSRPFNPGRAALAQINADIAATGGIVDAARLGARLPRQEQVKIERLVAMVARYGACLDEAPAPQLAAWQREVAAGEGDEEDVSYQRFLAMAESTATMEQLLDRVLLGQDADIERRGSSPQPASGSKQSEAVSLMTIHAAKGLEFPVVLVCGVEDGLLPLREPGKEVDEEEERRLFYVAMTRAQHQVVLFRARNRMRHGQRLQLRRSPFVDMIPADLLREEEEVASEAQRSKQLTLF